MTFHVLMVVGVVLAGCTREPGGTPRTPRGDASMSASGKLSLTSPAFRHGQAVPRKHSGDGDDVSPALQWTGAPQDTRELALIVDDPDAPTPEPWVHWVIYGIPATQTQLPEGIATVERLSVPPGAVQGLNSWNSVGYRGPAPPKKHGVHHYHFRIYALDAPLSLPPRLTKQELLEAMDGHILAQAELIGTYER